MMDEKELVNEVIRELKKRLNQGTSPEHLLMQEERHPCAEKGKSYDTAMNVMVLGNLTLREEEALSECNLAAAKEREFYDMVIAAQMSLDTMAQVALGNPRDKESSCLLKSLLEGKRVFLLRRGLEYRFYREKAPKTLYRLYQEYEDRICRYGARIINHVGEIREEIRVPGDIEELQDDCLSSGGVQEGCLDLTGAKVLTEAHFSSQVYMKGVGEAFRGKVRSSCPGTVLIDRNAVITPLAQDYIAAHRLRLVHSTR